MIGITSDTPRTGTTVCTKSLSETVSPASETNAEILTSPPTVVATCAVRARVVAPAASGTPYVHVSAHVQFVPLSDVTLPPTNTLTDTCDAATEVVPSFSTVTVNVNGLPAVTGPPA